MLREPAARFTFVAGKGGVGKSTAAAALALGWADAGRRTHLISTDPAHSLGDVFQLPSPLRADAVCTGRLRVEEFDAEARARSWTEELRAPLTTLFQQGSYLDDQDVARFTSLRLPGIDEVMAALRLLELAGDAAVDCVVVDTAPTGHTLRLLDAGAVLASWTAVLDALAAKGAAVAAALVGAVPHGPARALLDRLHGQLRAYEAEVLRAAACVIVQRAGEPVALETARLEAALRARALPVQARVHVGVGAAPGALQAPWLESPPRGCAALRAYLAALQPAGADVSVAPPAPAAGGDRGVAWLRAQPLRLWLFAGKGGVGKSTIAAAAAVALAEHRSVLLLSADPAGSLADVLDRAVGSAPVGITPRLRAAQIDAGAALQRWRDELRAQGSALLERIGVGAHAALDHRVLEALWDLAPPGVDELAALSDLMDAAAAEEVVVLDAAPTGHFLRLLALPETALEWTHAMMRTLLKYGVTGELDALARRLLAFARQLKEFRSLLADAGRTGVVVVTLDEPVVQAETGRLVAALADAGIPLSAILTNRSRAPTPHDVQAPALRAPTWPVPPRGASVLREFASRWELE